MVRVKHDDVCLHSPSGGSIEEKLEYSFRIYDADNSGLLSPVEVEQLFLMATRTKTRMQENEKKIFSKLEGDHFIFISDEMKKEIKNLVREIFDKVDTDRDGKLSLEEFKL
jgi:Ca2+-binding EF-hand superfamily protein